MKTTTRVGSCKLLGMMLFMALVFSSCHTLVPSLDYKAIATASHRLKLDIDYKDNHRLYIEASRWLGTPYRSGGTSRAGVDCSGLVCQLYRNVYHVNLPHNSLQQAKVCHKISRGQLKEGDLVFFASPRSRRQVAHVGIYLKKGKFIHASTSHGVRISSIYEDYYRKYWKYGGKIRKK